MARAKRQPKLSREAAIKVIKQEEPLIDFGKEDAHLCSSAELIYLAGWRNRLKNFRPKADFPGSMGRQVYEYLMRTKFRVFLIYQNRPERELLTVEMSRRELNENLKAYRQSAPEMAVSYKTRELTEAQINALE